MSTSWMLEVRFLQSTKWEKTELSAGRWWEEAHTLLPWIGASTGATYQPTHRRPAGRDAVSTWARGGLQRGALHTVPRPPDLRQQRRAEPPLHHLLGFGSRPGSSCIRQTRTRTASRGSGHRPLRQTDEPRQFGHDRPLGKGGSGEHGIRVDRAFFREISFAHKTTTEARTSSTNSWIASHVRRRRGYRPPRSMRLRQELRHQRKALAGHCYQLYRNARQRGLSVQ